LLISIKRGELLGIKLFHHAKAAELALDSVEVAMMIGEPRNKPIATNVIEYLGSLDDVHGKRKACDPGPAGKLVLEIEAR